MERREIVGVGRGTGQLLEKFSIGRNLGQGLKYQLVGEGLVASDLDI